jgi:hypothetical protein
MERMFNQEIYDIFQISSLERLFFAVTVRVLGLIFHSGDIKRAQAYLLID